MACGQFLYSGLAEGKDSFAMRHFYSENTTLEVGMGIYEICWYSYISWDVSNLCWD